MTDFDARNLYIKLFKSAEYGFKIINIHLFKLQENVLLWFGMATKSDFCLCKIIISHIIL